MKVSDTNYTNWHESRQKLKMERGVRLGRGRLVPACYVASPPVTSKPCPICSFDSFNTFHPWVTPNPVGWLLHRSNVVCHPNVVRERRCSDERQVGIRAWS